MKRKEYFGDRLYKDLSYIFDYYGIYHNSPKVWRKEWIFLEFYGPILLEVHAGRYPQLFPSLPKWLPYYCMCLIQEGICPLAGDGSKPITLQGPCEPNHRAGWEQPDDQRRVRIFTRGFYGRSKSEYNYGTNTNNNWK